MTQPQPYDDEFIDFPQTWFRQGRPVFRGENPAWDLAEFGGKEFQDLVDSSHYLAWGICTRWGWASLGKVVPLSYPEL